MNNSTKRIISGIVLTILFFATLNIAVIYPFIIKCVGLALLAICVGEYTTVVDKHLRLYSTKVVNSFIVIAILLAPILVTAGANWTLSACVSLLLVLVISMYLGNDSLEIVNVAISILFPAIVLISFGGAALLMVADNLKLLVFQVLLVSLNDVTAYEIGSVFQGKKIAPAISPNKTVIGSSSGLAVSFLVGVFSFEYFLDFPATPKIIMLIFLAMVASQIGDLLKSFIKRKCEVKDFADTIPGHGGVLDRLDGLLASSLFLVFYV